MNSVTSSFTQILLLVLLLLITFSLLLCRFKQVSHSTSLGRQKIYSENEAPRRGGTHLVRSSFCLFHFFEKGR
jgi:hypothetical protein